jgi:hypothetical protein
VERKRPAGGKSNDRSGKTPLLTVEEQEIIVKACRKYRQSIPAYLESARPELRTVDKIIDKLSSK